MAMTNENVKDHRQQCDTPMVSVVMIAYNNARHLPEAIRGVARQRTSFPVELVLCDDASTDETPSLVARFQKEYPGLISYHRNARNLGVQGNYLEAFRHVRGKYLAMCDADDFWTSRDKLATQVAYMETNPDCAVCFHRVMNWFVASGEKSLSNGTADQRRADTTVADLARRNPITNMSVLYRRELVDLTSLPLWLSEIRLLDYAMHMLYASHGKVHFINRTMGVYRQSPQAIWSMTEAYARMEMSLMVRIRLIHHFENGGGMQEGEDNDDIRKRVVANLREASMAILASMLRTVVDDAERREHTFALLREIGGDYTTTELERRAAVTPKGKSAAKRLLTFGRRMASRLLPVPHIG